MTKYTTKIEAHGLALQVGVAASYKYIRIIRISDSGVVCWFQHPYVGKLRELYAAFKAIAAPIVAADDDALTVEETETLTRLSRLITRCPSGREYSLTSAAA